MTSPDRVMSGIDIFAKVGSNEFGGDMQSHMITSIEELDRIVAGKPRITRTYRVSPDVFAANEEKRRRLRNASSRLRPMTDHEITEMAQYLGLTKEKIVEADPQADDISCPICTRKMTFLDLIHNSVSTGIHSRDFVAEVISGQRGYFITVDGSHDDTHRFKCLNCGDTSILDVYKEYRTCGGGGAYAHCVY